MEFVDKHDAVLLEILKETKSPPAFLDAVFGFLKRRTDFYIVQKDDAPQFGFASGFKEDLVYSSLKKFDVENVDLSYVPPAIDEIEITTEEVVTEKEPAKPAASTVKFLQEEFKTSEYYNGAKFDNYCWSQTNSDIDLYVQLPTEIQKAKDVDVSLSSMNVLVSKKNHPDEIYLKGQFKDKCRVNNVVWTLCNGKLQITIDKVTEQFWDRLFTIHDPIDVKKIDTSTALDNFPVKYQSTIEQMCLQDPKNTEAYDMLKKGWNVEGSPFAGQEFDPSKVEIVQNST